MKKVSVILLTAFILNIALCFDFSSAYKAEMINGNDGSYSDGVLYEQDFEKEDIRPYGFSAINGSAAVKSVDADHGKSLYIQNTPSTSAQATLNLEHTYTDGVYYVGYEVNHGSQKAFSYVSFLGCEKPLSESDYLKPFQFRNTGVYNLFKSLYKESIMGDLTIDPYYANYKGQKNYVADKWYRVDNYIDLNNRQFMIYIDGELFVQGPMPSYYKAFCGLRITQYKSGDSGSFYDNIKIYRLNGEIAFDLKNKGISIPDEYVNYADISFKCDTIGNIFFDDEGVKFETEIKNPLNKTQNLSAKFYARDKFNRVIWSRTSEIALAPNETKTEILNVDTSNKYGHFDLTAELTADEYDSVGKTETRFSYLVKPKKHNPRSGVANHFDRNGGRSGEMMQVLSKAGVDLVRLGSTAMQWADFEKEKDKFKNTETTEKALDECKENGITVMQLMFGGNDLYGTGKPPYTDSELAAFANACYEWVKASKGRTVYFEVWNEYDLPTFNALRRPVEDYVKMLKAVYPAVKAANPNAVVVGLSPSGQAWEWARSAVDAGALDYMDAVSLHPYASVMSPETYDMVEKVKSFKKYCESKGYTDLKWLTSETGWSSGDLKSDELQAIYEQRWMTLNTYYDLFDVLCKYTAMDHDISNVREQNFGYFKFWKYNDLNYEGKDNLITLSAFNSIMTNAKPIDDIQIPEFNAFRFKLEDGRQAIVSYALNENVDVALSTNVDEAEYVDMYGNRERIAAQDGKINLHLTKAPIYLIADNFGSMKKSDSAFAPTTDVLYGSVGGKTLLGISVPKDGVYSAEYTLIDGMKIECEYEKNGIHYAEIRMADEINSDDAIEVRLKNGGKTVYISEYKLEETNGVSAKMEIKPYMDSEADRWEAQVTVENTNYDESVSGTFKITYPESLAKKVGELKIPPISGGESRKISFFLPEINYRYKIEGICEFSNGAKVTVGGDYRLTTAAYATQKPKIDGIISPGEYDEDTKLTQAQFEVVVPSYGGSDDLNVNALYTSYDEDNIYISAEIYDDKQGYEIGRERIWAGDSIQFAIAFEKDIAAARTEVGFGLDKNLKPSVGRTLFMGSEDAVSFEGYELEIKRDEDKKLTVYEAKFPWDVLIPSNVKISQGETMYISFLVNENDEGTRRGWVKCGDGIDTVKDPSKYNELHLLKPRN